MSYKRYYASCYKKPSITRRVWYMIQMPLLCICLVTGMAFILHKSLKALDFEAERYEKMQPRCQHCIRI